MEKIVLGLGCLLVISLLTFMTLDNSNNVIDEEKESVNPCPNFDGREFLLTGGTVTADTIQEREQEFSRLNYLCGGK